MDRASTGGLSAPSAEVVDPAEAAPRPATPPRRATPAQRSTLRSVVVPSEHGGWGLTAEPVLLGLLVEPTLGGACIGLAAILAFLARTPLKVQLVDAHRGRTLDRTRTARWVLLVEGIVLAALVVVAVLRARTGFWWPVLVMAPLLAVELWFDMRSKSRRLVPELAGAIGIGGVVSLIVLAGGGGGRLAVALWVLVIARAVAAIVTVRDQVGRLHGRDGEPVRVVVADGLAVAIAASAVAVSRSALVGAVAVVAAVAGQRLLERRPATRAVVLGLRQSALGLVVVIAAAVGAWLA